MGIVVDGNNSRNVADYRKMEYHGTFCDVGIFVVTALVAAGSPNPIARRSSLCVFCKLDNNFKGTQSTTFIRFVWEHHPHFWSEFDRKPRREEIMKDWWFWLLALPILAVVILVKATKSVGGKVVTGGQETSAIISAGGNSFDKGITALEGG